MGSAKDMAAVWAWPWAMARANEAYWEMAASIPSVLAARMPVIANAIANPMSADNRELSLMVSEKIEAFDSSQKAFSRGAKIVQTAAESNSRALGKMSCGGWYGQNEFVAMAERNLAAWAALSQLPERMIAPLHRGVSGNAKRLAKPGPKKGER